jgi:hypothetical protein
MIILSEATAQLQPSASRVDVTRSIEAARLAGLDVYTIPPDFSVCETAENALWHLPVYEAEQLAFWIGYIPDPERYRAIYEAAARKHIRLINSPEEHLLAMEFHRFYSLLGDLTPRSIILTSPDDCVSIQDELKYPVFIKGTVQSRKHDGWDVCSRGTVIVRELVRLKHVRCVGNGFPAGREFRVFLLGDQVVEMGYYWDDPDQLALLAEDERVAIYRLASEAARRLAVPYMTADIGQLDTGEWIVIEVGDAQFAGLSQVSPLKLWGRLRELSTSSE